MDLIYTVPLKRLQSTAVLNINPVHLILLSDLVDSINDRVQSGSRNIAMMSEARNLPMPSVPLNQEADYSQTDHAKRHAHADPNFCGGT